MEEDRLKDILLFQIRRKITILYKDLLEIIEDLGDEHGMMMERLKYKLPSEAKTVEDCDYFSEERYQAVRKKVLDKGNDVIREIEENIKQFKISV